MKDVAEAYLHPLYSLESPLHPAILGPMGKSNFRSGTAGSVCVNHPQQPAAARCVTCNKPVCASCVVKANGRTFCSGACRENHAKYSGFKPAKESLLASLMSYVKLIIALAVIAAIAVLVGAKVLNLGFCQSVLKMFGL